MVTGSLRVRAETRLDVGDFTVMFWILRDIEQAGELCSNVLDRVGFC